MHYHKDQEAGAVQEGRAMISLGSLLVVIMVEMLYNKRGGEEKQKTK
jgi:hypothetical protein